MPKSGTNARSSSAVWMNWPDDRELRSAHQHRADQREKRAVQALGAEAQAPR